MLFISVLIVSVVVGSSLYNYTPQANNLVSFTCSPYSSSYTFTITSEVNLTNGMDQDEAVKVATQVFDKAREMTATTSGPRILESCASMCEDGTWIVWFDYTDSVYTERVHATSLARMQPVQGYFEVAIDPSNKTLVYSFQRHG